MVQLGPAAPETLTALGVELETLDAGRQRFAFECFDATERAPHLAGALGDAVAGALTKRGWLDRAPDSRVYALTRVGRRGLVRALGVDEPPG